MILIVDSGASKADWAIVDNGKLLDIIQTKGMSPFFQSSDDIYELVNGVFSAQTFINQIENIFFYGAGCIKGYNSDIIEKGLSKFFADIKIDVQSDMLGAARALFGKKEGIGCILGTGTNSCKYDGTSIIERIPALGFILGDECSGAYLGKALINNYFKKIMPPELAKEFEVDYQPNEKEVLGRVYNQPSANLYLASFTHFLKKHQEHQYVQDLLTNSFQAFISNNIAKYTNFQKFKVGLVGSIAYHFSEIINQVAVKNGIEIGKIMERPIGGLVEYYAGFVTDN